MHAVRAKSHKIHPILTNKSTPFQPAANEQQHEHAVSANSQRTTHALM
jgi:hypothetical protein